MNDTAVPEETTTSTTKPVNTSDDAKPKETDDDHNISSQSDSNVAKSATIPKYIFLCAAVAVMLL